jgi:hypothetical protein
MLTRVPFRSVILMTSVLSVPDAEGGADSGSRSGVAATTDDMVRETVPSMMPAEMNSTFSGAPIATAADLRAERQF